MYLLEIVHQIPNWYKINFAGLMGGSGAFNKGEGSLIGEGVRHSNEGSNFGYKKFIAIYN